MAQQITVAELALYLPYEVKIRRDDGLEWILVASENDKNKEIRFDTAIYLINAGVAKILLHPLDTVNVEEHGYDPNNKVMFILDVLAGFVSVNVHQGLCRNHFDVAHLIKKGLAININEQ